MCNPLGSKRKIHKLGKEPDTFGLMLIIINVLIIMLLLIGFFYFQLANLSPWMRTKINDVFLVAVVKKNLIDKYSMQVVLKPIIEDIKKLVSKCANFICSY